jgi:hypothetical protein
MRSSGSGVFGYMLAWESTLSRFAFHIEKSGIGTTSVYTFNNSAPAAIWSHVTAVYSNKSMKIYCNGQLHNSETFGYDTGTTTPNNVLTIGCRSYNVTVFDWFFTGIIDDTRIYNRALSDGEVQQLYEAGLP